LERLFSNNPVPEEKAMLTSVKIMIKKLKVLRLLRREVGRLLESIRRLMNGMGNKRRCYICGRTFNYFTKFRGGNQQTSDFRKKLDTVGSDADNFGCMYCESFDRERHLFMYFDKLNLWDRMKNQKILHFAPEKHVQRRIMELGPQEYVQADLFPKDAGIRKVDATEIPFSEGTFDFVIANHILEHIPHYRKALSEFFRVMRPGGVGIFQTPYSRLLISNFEDEGIQTDELRRYFYGQEDHVRTFGERQFLKSLENAGFVLQRKMHGECFDTGASYYYGVNKKEDLIMVAKPTESSPETGGDCPEL